jgi:monothiol glutaredoxin
MPDAFGSSLQLGYACAFTARSPRMPRRVLDQSRIHPAIREKIANYHADIVHNVQAAALSNTVLVVGMGQNPFCRKARRLLAAAGVPFHYLEYGSYLSQWRPRSTLKMWTGWPTFPMVFVKSTLVGGAGELAQLIESGELKRMLSA